MTKYTGTHSDTPKSAREFMISDNSDPAVCMICGVASGVFARNWGHSRDGYYRQVTIAAYEMVHNEETTEVGKLRPNYLGKYTSLLVPGTTTDKYCQQVGPNFWWVLECSP